MSYILDALKKSEQERKLAGSPDISSEHQVLQQASGGHNKKTIIAFVLLILALLGAGAWFVQNSSLLDSSHKYPEGLVNLNSESKPREPNDIGQESQANNTHNSIKRTKKNNLNDSSSEYEITEAEIENSELEVIRPSKERRAAMQKSIQANDRTNKKLKDEYREYFDETESVSSLSEASKGLADQQNAQLQQSETEAEIKTEEETETEEATLSNTSPQIKEIYWNDFQSIASLNTNIKQQIPDIRVTTHIYSSAASFRKVTINGLGAKQGAEISDGLVLEYILEDGVVFSFKGNYFRMKALESWTGE
jgi:general secretion pathway protein B